VPFTLRNIKEHLEDIGFALGGPPDLEFRATTKPLNVPPGTRRGYEAGPEGLESSSSARPISARIRAGTPTAGATGGPPSRALIVAAQVLRQLTTWCRS